MWNPWDKKAKAMSDFGDDEYKYMLCVEAAAIEKPISLNLVEGWNGRLELSTVSSSYCSGKLIPKELFKEAERSSLCFVSCTGNKMHIDIFLLIVYSQSQESSQDQV